MYVLSASKETVVLKGENMKLLITLALVMTSITSFADDNRAQRVKRLSKDVTKLVNKHFEKLDREDKRYVRNQLREIKFIFEDYGFQVPGNGNGNNRNQKYLTARCKVSGYSDNNLVGPAKSIEELQEICKMSKGSAYRSKTYIDDIQSTTYKVTAGTYFSGNCRVGGYSDNNPVGPAKTIEDLHAMCKASKGTQYRAKTYLTNVASKDYPTRANAYFQANCKVAGYSDNGKVGPANSIEKLHELCKKSKGSAYRSKTYLQNITVLDI